MNVANNLFKKCVFVSMLPLLTACFQNPHKVPNDFVFLLDVDPTIVENSRYYTAENFMGRPVPGYSTSKIVCTKEAAEQLKKANDFFKAHGYKVVVYDGYRPQSAVDAFKRWGQNPKDNITKAYYYPFLDKSDLFKLGYIGGEKSTHSRGSTFDLTLIRSDQSLKPIIYSKRKLQNGEEISFLDDNTVDMGSSFDLFHEASHHDSNLVNPSQNEMRNFLRETMKRYGFAEYKKEWWHYTLAKEPYPNTYFGFVVK
jgi:zinc D-Ala-D-Ala dipeptidase